MILTWWWSISSLEKGRIKLQRECQTEWNWSNRAKKGSLSMGWMEIGTLISIAPRGAKKVPNIGRRLVAISALLWSATSSPRGQKLQVLGSAAAAGKRLPFLPRPAGRKQYFSRNWARCCSSQTRTHVRTTSQYNSNTIDIKFRWKGNYFYIESSSFFGRPRMWEIAGGLNCILL